MKQEQIFSKAKWIGANMGAHTPIIRKKFNWNGEKNVTLSIIGLGTFECFINGSRVSDEYFLPLTSKFDESNLPVGEELFGFRVYVTEYDITDLLRKGENVISVLLGEGFYTELRYYGIHRILGEKKLIFKIKIGNNEIVSDGTERYALSFITRSGFHEGGEHDYRGWSNEVMSPDFDDSNWELVREMPPLINTEYCYTDCPADKIIRTLPANLVFSTDSYKIYDCTEGTTGYPIVISDPNYSGEVKITLSEKLTPDGKNLDDEHVFMQHLYATVDGRETVIIPHFTWFGFRYFRIEGGASCKEVKVIHSNIEVNSGFKTNDKTLNWIYDAYINTQLTNMHRGGPSDCPHLERELYTGDGQLLSKTAMMALNAKSFYAKWIVDISDSQDKITGRIQYTAPYFISCGGGPGGWSSAIIIVPYEYYKAYGDDTYIKLLYPQMKHYLEFLKEHSDSYLVTSFKEGNWCLGDWAGPKKWMLPAPFVNTYFHIVSLTKMIEIAKVIGAEADIPEFEERIKKCKESINKFYFNSFKSDDCYCANVQGANAFALDIGLGTDITKKKLISYYTEKPYYDTGIFGTEIVTRILFELGESNLAYKLLTASNPFGYGKWYADGETTLHEYFITPSRSHSHPMFGAVVALLYEYIVGIRQKRDSSGYKKITISPVIIDSLDEVSGFITSPRGRISLSYKTENRVRYYKIEIPPETEAEINIPGLDSLIVGEGSYRFETTI